MYPQPPIVWIACSHARTATSDALSLDIDPSAFSNGLR